MAEDKAYASVVDLLRDSEETRSVADDVEKRIAERRLIKRLMALRAHRGMSQGDIAKAMDCTQSRISKLESSIDDDLRLGDLDGYLDALGLDITVVVSKKHGIRAADAIKYHWQCLGKELDRLLDLAHDDGDSEIAHAIGKFSNEVACNYLARIVDFLNRLPSAAREEVPFLGIAVEDISDDDISPDDCSSDQQFAALP